jgi:hypothetical protein
MSSISFFPYLFFSTFLNILCLIWHEVGKWISGRARGGSSSLSLSPYSLSPNVFALSSHFASLPSLSSLKHFPTPLHFHANTRKFPSPPSHPITSHHIPSHPITSHHIPSHPITPITITARQHTTPNSCITERGWR